MSSRQTKEIFKEFGLKATPRRLAIYDLLATTAKPLDAKEIKKNLGRFYLKINKATIYRILKTLSKKNLVIAIELNEGKFRYELADHHHHHLVCLRCDRIQDIDSCRVDIEKEKIKSRYLFDVQNHRLEFFGVCQNCRIGYNGDK